MATVYLHIGAPKTGTSTLQHVLAKNYRRLLKAGVLYPCDMRHGDAHHTLVCDLIEKYQGSPMADIWYGPQQRGQAWELLQAELKRHERTIHSVIISSELFFGQNTHLGKILEDVSVYLQGHDVRVVVYLRRQDQLYSSFYNQDVKGARQWSHCAYQFYQTHQIFQQSYHSLLDVWSGVFGKRHIVIRPFEPGQWLNGDIVQDFCAATDTLSLRSGYEECNESLGVVQLYVKRCLNKIGFAKEINDGVLEVLLEVCPEKPAKGGLYIHRGLYDKYREQWLQENIELSRDYLNQLDLFSQPIPESHEVKLYEINPGAAGGYIANMVRIFAQGRYPEYRQLFARATLVMIIEKNMWPALDADSRAVLLGWV